MAKKPYFTGVLLARPRELESPAFCSGGRRSIQLSYGRMCFLFNFFVARMTRLELAAFGFGNSGTGSDLLLRRQTLYPTELRAHISMFGKKNSTLFYSLQIRYELPYFQTQAVHFFFLVVILPSEC